ncbi:MAG: hypothetical protein ABL921_17905 [Pirellula sp.]
MRYTSCCIFLFLLLQIESSAIGQTPEFDDVRKRALAFVNRIASQPTGKLHGFVESPNVRREVWLEYRGDAMYIEHESFEGKTELERKKAEERSKRLLEISGSNPKAIESFERNVSYRYLPFQLEVRIEDKPFIPYDTSIEAIMPKSWTCFIRNSREPFLRFSYLLDPNTPNVKVLWDEGRKVVRFTHESDVPASNPQRAFATRYIDVDPVSAAVVRYETSGGMLSEIGQLHWNQSSGYWYVDEGQVEYHGKLQSKWSIVEYSADAKSVRPSFAIIEAKLPLGTRITDSRAGRDGKGRVIRFVGGEKGKIEHDLRTAALKLENSLN